MNSIELNLSRKQRIEVGDEMVLKDGKTAVLVRIVDAPKRQILVRDEVGSPRLITEDDIVEILVRAVRKTGILARIAGFVNRYL